MTWFAKCQSQVPNQSKHCDSHACGAARARFLFHISLVWPGTIFHDYLHDHPQFGSGGVLNATVTDIAVAARVRVWLSRSRAKQFRSHFGSVGWRVKECPCICRAIEAFICPADIHGLSRAYQHIPYDERFVFVFVLLTHIGMSRCRT